MAQRTTHWRFTDIAERDSFGTAQGVGTGDTCYVQSTNQQYAWDGAAWQPIPPGLHAPTHSQGGTDPINVEDLATTSNNTALVFAPDGAGGVQLRAEQAEAQTWADTLTLGNLSSGNDPQLTEGDELIVTKLDPNASTGFRGYITGRTASVTSSGTTSQQDVGADIYNSGNAGDPGMALVRVQGVIGKKPAGSALLMQPFVIEQVWDVGAQSIIATYRLEGAAAFASGAEAYVELYSPAAGAVRLRFTDSASATDTFYVIANCEVTAGFGPIA